MAATAENEDLSSLSNPSEITVTHLDWKASAKFDKSILVGSATYSIKRNDSNAKSLCLDTSHLVIESVSANGRPLPYKLHIIDKPHLGQKLEIFVGSNDKISIDYRTTLESSALQWLPPSQTAGKVHPYLFSQCQAIHARTMLPCQDRPGVKMTYAAEISVPTWATCVMSALSEGTTIVGDNKTCIWKQPVPVSSYLIALAVGDLTKVDLSKRCAIWSEPSLIQAAGNEFAQTEEFLKIAEDIAGTPYVWGRYDLLCLPPSFPYGGMENPCLTFVTPTLLAGDRSLADVVAHEIAHSWTGNLVTNTTWEHFWLNEGWTTWFQRKIMARIHKDPNFGDFDAIAGYKHLQESVDLMPDEFTSLVPVLSDMDPDDYYSSVPYEKGFCLLYTLEKLVGTPAFEAFFKAYVKEFSYKTLSSDDFRDFFMTYFLKANTKVKDFDWQAWYHAPGMPPDTPKFDTSLAEASQELALAWKRVDKDAHGVPRTNLAKWTSPQVTCFLDVLLADDAPLKLETVQSMNEEYGFSNSQNSEILFRYCQLAIAAGDESILPVTVRFITTQGRMKFVRPLYRSLAQTTMGKQLAIDTFLQNKDFYHPICSKMIATDLSALDKREKSKANKQLLWIVGIASVAGLVGLVLFRKRR